MAHVRAPVDHQALDLVEHRRVGGVAVAAIGAARCDDPKGRLVRHHVAHLDGRGMGAQHQRLAGLGGLEEERVVHLPSWMLGREVECGEIVEVVSTSGPSATEKPISAKIAVGSSVTWLTGWIRPSGNGLAGKVTSMGSASSRAVSALSARADLRSANSSSIRRLSTLKAWPAFGRSSTGRLLTPLTSSVTRPFFAEIGDALRLGPVRGRAPLSDLADDLAFPMSSISGRITQLPLLRACPRCLRGLSSACGRP